MERAVPWLWAIVAAAPFLFVNLLHASCPAGHPTGFIGYDQPYYVANGRAIFERGNGLAYPNPFDPDDQAPAIYFHWLIWLIGFAVAKCRVDPGVVVTSVHVIGAAAAARVTWSLVRSCLPSPRGMVPLFLLSMWGGGLFVTVNLLQDPNLVHATWADLLRPDPSDGWWFLNWGRNLVFPLESVYHAIMCAAWLFVLTERWAWALLAGALLAATHPFCGLQALAILVAWSVVSLLRRSPHAAPYWFALGAIGLGIGFLVYNLWYLAEFAQHRLLVDEWSISWTLDWPVFWRAYGPVAAVAAVRLIWHRSTRDGQAAFLVVCFGVSLLLAKHELFAAPRQPLHFTRGYIWMPLCLLGLPALQAAHDWVFSLPRRLVWAGPVVLLTAALAVLDNAVFVAQYAARRAEYGFFLSDSERELFRTLAARRDTGVLLAPDARLGYLSAVYTSLRPDYGHLHNTPDFTTRERRARQFYKSGEELPWMKHIDVILLRQGQTVPDGAWTVMYANRDWVVCRRS
jgi:hypothetical protein